jgi:hypothetical protein
MESDHLTRKLAAWDFILKEYNFDIIYKANKVHMDVNGLNWNWSSNKEGTIEVHWLGNINLTPVPWWHASNALGMCFKLTWVMGIPMMHTLN